MKKTVLASLMLLIICAFAAYLFLVYYFDERSFDILEETIYVLFTGCIFNISSTIIVLLFGWIRNSQKEYRLKFSLKKTLIEIDQRISNNIVNDINMTITQVPKSLLKYIYQEDMSNSNCEIIKTLIN